MPRKHFTTSLDEDLLKAVKKLAIDLDCTVNDLLEEGIDILLNKYQGKVGVPTGESKQKQLNPTIGSVTQGPPKGINLFDEAPLSDKE